MNITPTALQEAPLRVASVRSDLLPLTDNGNFRSVFEMEHQSEVLTVMLYDMCMYICVLAYHWPLTVHTSFVVPRQKDTEGVISMYAHIIGGS